ncbi:hypothetical protein RD1_1470 [Roseobacter denitrificans OCh 114]|uniref:Uncharacterized protein n=1 Tax=Roseobacter denitrificans (strain ATCC 33942 / OCh 114) TaxID=375451 RepID=Q16A89_ROSDO|nr:hypothetical protein RD1_1470 [Roseobacter denitrificans OCh 114]
MHLAVGGVLQTAETADENDTTAFCVHALPVTLRTRRAGYLINKLAAVIELTETWVGTVF